MALVISAGSRSAHKASMLKECLLDDLGSCSSSGFRSFPRRQCCAAVTSRGFCRSSRRIPASRSKFSSRSASSKISRAVQKASMAVISSAAKLLPFRSPAPETSRKKKTSAILPRSLSKRIFKWKADNRSRDCEIERWISSGAAAAEKYQPLDLSLETTASTTITVTSASTTSSTNGDGWSESDSEFTLPASSLDENGVVEGKSSSLDDSHDTTTTKEKWNNEGDKEQLSPVSVLDFPDEDDEAGSSSPFTRRLSRLEGTKDKLMYKLRRFESLSRLNPTSLELRLSTASDSEDGSPKLSFELSPSPLHSVELTEEETEEVAAARLLEVVKADVAGFDWCKFDFDGLVLGFFQSGVGKGVAEEALVAEVEGWLRGRAHDEVAVRWKAGVYVEEMEERGVWRSGPEEIDDVVVAVEGEVLAALVDEVVMELGLL